MLIDEKLLSSCYNHFIKFDSSYIDEGQRLFNAIYKGICKKRNIQYTKIDFNNFKIINDFSYLKIMEYLDDNDYLYVLDFKEDFIKDYIGSIREHIVKNLPEYKESRY